MTTMTLSDAAYKVAEKCANDNDAWKAWRVLADVIEDHLANGAQEWQPIETAPKDGLPRLYLCNGKVIQGFVDATGSLCKQDELGWLPMRKNPTHWMRLPAAPMLSQRGEVEGG